MYWLILISAYLFPFVGAVFFWNLAMDIKHSTWWVAASLLCIIIACVILAWGLWYGIYDALS